MREAGGSPDRSSRHEPGPKSVPSEAGVEPPRPVAYPPVTVDFSRATLTESEPSPHEELFQDEPSQPDHPDPESGLAELTQPESPEPEPELSDASYPTVEPQEPPIAVDDQQAETGPAELGQPAHEGDPLSWNAVDTKPNEPETSEVPQPTAEAPEPLARADRPGAVSEAPETLENPQEWLKRLERRAEGSEAARQAAADEFMQTRTARLRGILLGGPVATLIVETPEDHARLIMQLDLYATEARRARDLASDLAEAYVEAGGKDAHERLRQMLEAAKTVDGHPAWIDELWQEVVEAFVEKAVAEVACQGLATALAIVLAVPTGPVSALFAAGSLLRAAGY